MPVIKKKFKEDLIILVCQKFRFDNFYFWYNTNNYFFKSNKLKK